jgi:hypothetical protein
MDATALKVAATGAIHVKNAAGEPLYDGENPVRIIVHGPGSRAYGTVEARQQARALKRMNENEGKVTAPTSEERRKEVAEDLTTLTVNFEHLTHGDLQGVALFEAVYGDPELGFIARQVERHLKDWANFTVASAAS